MTPRSVSVPYMQKAIAWAFERAPDEATSAQSIVAAAESGAGLIALVKEAKLTFGGRSKQSLLLRRCGLITGLALRAAHEVAPLDVNESKAFAQEVERAWGVCAETVPDPEEAARDESLSDWLRPPLSTPWGMTLWHTLTRRPARGLDPWLSTPEERRAFERLFMAAWSLNTSTGEGEALEREVRGLRRLDAARLREQLVADLASWGGRHVFGNLRAGADLQGMPWMSLEAVYVEPEVEGWRGETIQSGPALKTLWETVQTSPLTLVTAEMGGGKTLTARMFVTERALDWMAARDAPEEPWLPVYVRCAEDMSSGRAELGELVVAAWRRQWEELSGERPSASDVRSALPHDGARLVIVLDGLDEVNLSEEEVQHLIQTLREAGRRETLRVVVFGRADALPESILRLPGTVSFDLQPFYGRRVEEWLGRWARLGHPGPTPEEAEDPSGFSHLMRSPSLLFLIAWTWGRHGCQGPNKAALVERILRTIVQRKAEHDRESHPGNTKTAREVLERLKAERQLPSDATLEDATLWVLSRVALELHRRQQRPDVRLSRRRDVERLLSELLNLDGDAGVWGLLSFTGLLTTRAELPKDQSVVSFRHRTIQEFLVAWAWRAQLRRIVATTEDRAREEEVLEDVLIQAQGEETLNDLIELIQAEDAAQRTLLKDWAKRMVEDLRVGPLIERGAERRETGGDTRAPLALAAFAIGGALSGAEGFVVEGPLPLLRVLAWAGLTQRWVTLVAPRLTRSEARGWVLTHASLRHADLRGARLSGADLSHARLLGADLSGASLSGATLHHADLLDTNLCDANLSGAQLNGACLLDAWLCNADLSHAGLFDADLSLAHLSGARLSHTKLCGADLSTAKDLSTADLHNAQFTLNHPRLRDTRWPPGFDPVAAGALPNNPDGSWPAPRPEPAKAETPPPSAEDGDP